MKENILLKVKTSCRSHEIPHTLLYSARGWRNDESTGHLFQEYGGYEVKQDQHLRYLDNTVVTCQQGVGFDKPCEHIYDWHKRIYLARSNIKGKKAWQFVLMKMLSLKTLPNTNARLSNLGMAKTRQRMSEIK